MLLLILEITELSNDTIVWFSRTDEVLFLLYPMGNTAPSGKPMLALSITGALQHYNIY